MTSHSGQSSVVHLRLEYTQMRSEPDLTPLYDLHSPVGEYTRPHLPPPTLFEGYTHRRAESPPVASLPQMIHQAKSSSVEANSNACVAAHYRTHDAHVVEGFEGMQTLRLVPDVPAKPIFIRSCKSTGDDPLVFEVAGLAESITITSCSRVRIVAAMVLNTVQIVTSEDVELVLGGEAPRLMLAGVQGCVITLHKATWNGNIECMACSGVSLNAVEAGEPDTLSLQESTAMERVLLPDSLQTVVQKGRMTTQCHFTHLNIPRSSPPPTHSSEPATSDQYYAAGVSGEDSNNGEHFGVGLLLRKTEEGEMQVARVAEGGAAYLDGRTEVGDILIAINGISTCGKRLREIGEELSGPVGSEVYISLEQVVSLSSGTSRLQKHIVLPRRPISTIDPYTTRGSFFGPRRAAQNHSSTLNSHASATGVPDVQSPPSDRGERLKDTRSCFEHVLSKPSESASRVGVGLAVRPAHDGVYLVSGLVSNGAAEASGQIVVGDVLHSVDGLNVCFKSHEIVKDLVQGPPGSCVVLSFLRPEALAEDLHRSVNEFDNWRPVVLQRNSNPSGSKTPPVTDGEDEEPIDLMPQVGRITNAVMVRSAAPPVTAEREIPQRREEAIGLTLHLDENYNTVAGTETSKRVFSADLELDLSTCLKTHQSRIQVVDLLPGSVLADVHIFPAAHTDDQRSPERLAAEIAVMVVDPQVATPLLPPCAHTGARRRGALAPTPLRATRSSKSQVVEEYFGAAEHFKKCKKQLEDRALQIGGLTLLLLHQLFRKVDCFPNFCFPNFWILKT